MEKFGYVKCVEIPEKDDRTIRNLMSNESKIGAINETLPDLAVAYFSLVNPDGLSGEINKAAHPSGMEYMREILKGLKTSPGVSTYAVAAAPFPAYPQSSMLIHCGGRMHSAGNEVNYVPYLNLSPLKQMCIGAMCLYHLIKWRWLSRKAKARIVLAFNLSVPPISCIAIGAKILGLKVAAYICDVSVPGSTVPKTLFHQIDAVLQRYFIKRVDSITVITDAIAQDLAPKTPYLRIDGGVNAAMHGIRAPEKSRNVSEKFIITWAGTLSEFNGIRQVIEALSIIRDDDIVLNVAGRGLLTSFVEKSAAYDRRINYLGFVAKEKLRQIFQESDLLLSFRLTQSINTRYAFPSKFLEYLASGTPVLATPTGHLEEEYSNVCYVLKDDSVEGLAAKILQIKSFTHRERFEVGLRAETYLRQEKSWHQQVQKLIVHLKRCAVAVP